MVHIAVWKKPVRCYDVNFVSEHYSGQFFPKTPSPLFSFCLAPLLLLLLSHYAADGRNFLFLCLWQKYASMHKINQIYLNMSSLVFVVTEKAF